MEYTPLAAILAACFVFLMYLSRTGRREPGLPPGPPTIPFFGNMLSFPRAFSHLQLTAWAREFGEIYSLKLGSTTIVVLSGTEAVKTMLDVGGSLTGDRPQFPVFAGLTEGDVATHGTHTEGWKIGRKAIHTFFTQEMVDAHFATQTAESFLLLHDILTTPKNLYTHIQRTTASIMINLLFGKRCPTYKNSDAERTFEAIHAGASLMDAGFSTPIEFLPFLRNFNPWKSAIQSALQLRRKVFVGLLDECDRKESSDCFMKKILTNQTQLGLRRVEVEQLAALLLDAGAVTTTSVIYNLIFALICFPEVQAKAQEEIDHVVGSNRLPEMADLVHLPYVNALIKETHRFRPVLPTGVPHAAFKDIQYKGYLIPKGSTIYMNVWGIHHDPELFEEPNVFKPERFLITEHGMKPGIDDKAMRSDMVFGAGRRKCPGEHFATNFVALNAMLLLWGFKFGPGISTTGTGHPLDLSNYASPSIELTPDKFSCEITPRGKDRVSLIKQSFAHGGSFEI